MRFWLPATISAIASFVFGILLGPLTTIFVEPYFSNHPKRAWAVTAFVAAIWGISWLLSLRRERTIETRILEARVLGPNETPRQARRALIALVSVYTSRLEPQPDKASITRALRERDLNALDLEHSNLWPLLSTLKLHRATLEHVWLIASDASLESAAVSVAYARKELGLTCLFHHGQTWSISKPFTAQVVADIKDVVGAAVREAKRHGIDATQIITDVTGGTVPMSLGATLACLHPMLDVQYTAMPNREGDLEALVIRFEPEISMNG
jgi:hypothetical protein